MEAGLIKVERSGNEKEGTAVSKDAPFDEATKKAVQQIPLLSVKAGPRDTQWVDRLKEEYHALIQFVRTNKANDQDWFYLKAADKEGIHWEGKCWHFHENVKYEFDLCFELPVGYPLTPPELKLPELDGKTVKMYHGGKICLTVHFQPLWTRNAPRFGIAHALALGLGPWLASEVPDLVRRGAILPK